MKAFPILILLLFGFISCQDVERMEKPEDLIPKEKMTEVLLELSLLNAAKSTNRKQFEEMGIDPDEYLWDLYDIDSLQFAKSNKYYTQNYEEYEEIYLEVQSRLAVLKTTYDSIREKRDRIKDSIRAAIPEDSLRKVNELKFRDSILTLPSGEGGVLPVPLSRKKIAKDTIW